MRPRLTSRILALAIAFAAVALLGTRCPGGPPDELGPWAVGRATFEVVDPDRDDRTLPVDVWYPAIDDGAIEVIRRMRPTVVVTEWELPGASGPEAAGSSPSVSPKSLP